VSFFWVYRGRNLAAAVVERVCQVSKRLAVLEKEVSMRAFIRWAVVLIVPALLVQAARPEKEKEPLHAVPEGATIKLLLLRQKSVQKELDVSAETAEKIMDFTHKQHEAFKKILDLDKDKHKEEIEKLRKQNEKFLTETLTAKQDKRLDQIAMQFSALTHLTRPEIAKDLKLTDDQITKLKDLQKEARKGLLAITTAKEKEGKTEKLKKLRMDTRTKILDVLTDDQKAEVRKLAGEPFEGEIVFEEEP
jgi:hypothetical protein